MARSKTHKVKGVLGPPYHISLIGSIHPVGSVIHINDAPSINYKEAETGVVLDFKVNVTASRIRVDCALNTLPDDYLIYIIYRAGEPTKTMIDLVAFQLGLGVIAVWNKYVDIDGVTKDIAYIDPKLPQYCTSIGRDARYQTAIELAIKEPSLGMALNDLILANTLPHQVPANCGRVVEGIRHLMAGPGADAKKAWPVMREALNVDESFITFITNYAMPYRHGNRIRISQEDTALIIQRTWQIMDRYLHLRLRQLVKLPDAEFPILKG